MRLHVVRLAARICAISLATVSLTAATAIAQDEPDPNPPQDFSISRAWLESLRAQKTFLPTFRLELKHRSGTGQGTEGRLRDPHGRATRGSGVW
jgi:hypothetical protein